MSRKQMMIAVFRNESGIFLQVKHKQALHISKHDILILNKVMAEYQKVNGKKHVVQINMLPL
ncbi:MAG: hypothetical protein LBH90_05865 [Tannerella sp.]|jgi:hypothetical protein|nr:hypothetical protein [Tannerella sp.]